MATALTLAATLALLRWRGGRREYPGSTTDEQGQFPLPTTEEWGEGNLKPPGTHLNEPLSPTLSPLVPRGRGSMHLAKHWDFEDALFIGART